MGLKAKLSKEDFDKLPDTHREFYKEGSDGYLLDAEGVEDVSGLKSALEKEKKDRKLLKAEVEKFKDLDPDKARQALAKLQELDEKTLIDKGEFDRLLKKRSDEFDAKEAELNLKLTDASKRLDVFELVNPVRSAALKAGVLPEDIEDVLKITSHRFKLDEHRKPVVLDADGDVSTLSVDKFWSEEFKAARPKFYAASSAAGSGAITSNGGAGGGSKIIKRSEFDGLDQSQRMAKSKEGYKVVDD